MWRPITDPAWQIAAYIGAIVWETVTGLVLATAVMERLRGHRPERGRWLSTLGLVMVLALFLVGFVVGGGWFQMWRSTAWNGLEPASRNTVFALFTLVLLHIRPHTGTTA